MSVKGNNLFYSIESESHLEKQEARRQRQEKRQQLLKERHQAKQKTLGAQKLK